MPFRLTVREGPEGDVFLPVLYPNSHENPDDAIKLGRMTDWKGGENGPVLGVGMRIFLFDDADVPLPEWRQLQVL